MRIDAVSETYEEIFADLGKILQQETQVYESILGITKQERQIIIKGSPEEMLQSNKQKDTSLMEIKILEEARQAVVKKLSKRLGIPVGQLTLSALMERLHPVYQQRFSEQSTQLRETIAELKQTHQTNSALLKHSLSFVRDWLHLLLVFGGGGSTYGSDGMVQGPEKQLGTGHNVGVQV